MKKIVGVFTALMVALAMTGVAFACWSQTIYVEGTVETGTVCVGWSDVDSWDNEYLGKDVGSVDAQLENVKGFHGETLIYETLVINLSNVYPGYEAWIEVSISNGGTIPVNLVDFDISPVEDPENLLKHVYWDIIDVEWENFPQIDPCQTVTAWICIQIIQEVDGQECPQDASATFAGYLTFCQWNEAEECIQGPV